MLFLLQQPNCTFNLMQSVMILACYCVIITWIGGGDVVFGVDGGIVVVVAADSDGIDDDDYDYDYDDDDDNNNQNNNNKHNNKHNDNTNSKLHAFVLRSWTRTVSRTASGQGSCAVLVNDRGFIWISCCCDTARSVPVKKISADQKKQMNSVTTFDLCVLEFFRKLHSDYALACARM